VLPLRFVSAAAVLLLTALLGLTACADDTGDAATETRSFADPTGPITGVAVGDDFEIVLSAPPDELRWALSPRPSDLFVIARPPRDLTADERLGGAGSGTVFEFRAVGGGSTEISFQAVRQGWLATAPEGAPRTVISVTIDGPPRTPTPTAAGSPGLDSQGP
jgi:hypothetical protein